MQRIEKSHIPVLIISLARSQDRKNVMSFQLERLGLEYSFIDAVDGNLLSEEERKKVESQRDKEIYKKAFTNGEIGCMYSHMRAYKEILNSEDAAALILEDDVFLSERVADFLNRNVIESLPKDWDIVLLAYVQRGNVESRPSKRAVMSYWGRKKLPSNFLVGKPVQFSYHAAAYVVSKQGAKKLQEAGTPLRMPADILTGNAQEYGINLYMLSTPIVRQHHEWALKSTIKTDKQDAEYAFDLNTNKNLTLSNVAHKLIFFSKRIISYTWNKYLLVIRGHGGPAVFLKKLGILKRDKIN